MSATMTVPTLEPWDIEESIRVVGRSRYLCPPTTHWGGWHDDDAIRYHGIPIGTSAVGDIQREIEICAKISVDLDDDDDYRPVWSPVEQFTRLQEAGFAVRVLAQS